jgi:hypothetical protein
MSDLALCPQCGQGNGCLAVSPGGDPAACWCQQVEIPAALLDRLPAVDRNRRCVCRGCVEQANARRTWNPQAGPGEFYRLTDGRMVFTERYHLRRGYCCGNGCRHCPFEAEGQTGAQAPREVLAGQS